MIGPYESRRCDWCDQPVSECDCELDDVLDAGYPRGGGDEQDGDGWWWDNRTVVTIDTGGLL